VAWVAFRLVESLSSTPLTFTREATLSDDALDRIDEIVPPGITISPGDVFFANPALEPQARRR
jgi:hypothetical protein